MIANKDRIKEAKKLAQKVNKPKQEWWAYSGNPEQMGLHRLGTKKHKTKK